MQKLSRREQKKRGQGAKGGKTGNKTREGKVLEKVGILKNVEQTGPGIGHNAPTQDRGNRTKGPWNTYKAREKKVAKLKPREKKNHTFGHGKGVTPEERKTTLAITGLDTKVQVVPGPRNKAKSRKRGGKTGGEAGEEIPTQFARLGEKSSFFCTGKAGDTAGNSPGVQNRK